MNSIMYLPLTSYTFLKFFKDFKLKCFILHQYPQLNVESQLITVTLCLCLTVYFGK